MKWTDTFKIREKEYRFIDTEDDPLYFIMHINESYFLSRHINCDSPTEQISLHQKYVSVKNGISKDDIFSIDVYHGKDIQSESFLSELLENVLEGFGLI